MAKQVTFNDNTNERDKELVGKIKLFSKEKKISFTEAVRQLCEYALTAKKIQKIIEQENRNEKDYCIGAMRIMLLSLCACADTAKKLTKAEIESALDTCSGTLETKGKEDNVKSFTFTMTDVNAENLSDSDFLFNAIIQVATDGSGANTYQLKSASTFGPVGCIYFLIA